MHLPRRPSWFLPESAVTPEAEWRSRPRPGRADPPARSRREFLRRGAGLTVAGAFLGGSPAEARSVAEAGLPETGPLPVPVAPSAAHDGAGLVVTEARHVTTYNNFYEFGYDKADPARNANRGWRTRPWTLRVDGLVRKPLEIDVDDLLRRVGGLEQRVYRFRCVEAWSMVVPWDGFPLARLLDLVEPTDEARYVRFETFLDPASAPEQARGGFPWPYEEGLRLDEARHDLTLLAAGIYGRILPNQNGAPLRLVVPWKYGFKSIKSIVRIELVAQRPVNTWQRLAAHEYGFFANVNPLVDHPRWSQATERVIGAGLFGGRVPTLPFNGYAREVAALYRGLDPRTLY